MKKVLASAFLAAVVMVSSLTVAHADLISTILENAILWCVRVEEVNSNEDEWVAARDGLDTIWRSSPISQPIDYTAQLTAVADKLDTLISQSSDTVVNVVTNNTYITNVYQLDDENDVADRSKEGIEKIGGVFKWLWKHAFKDAFGAADVTKLDGLL